jgi:hypothetical protein
MPDEQELFVIDYPRREAAAVWPALKRALATMDLQDPAPPQFRTFTFEPVTEPTKFREHSASFGRIRSKPQPSERESGQFLVIKLRRKKPKLAGRSASRRTR